jgi:hypothetical protein
MSDRAIPFSGLGKGTYLRFTRQDVTSLESAFGALCGKARVGYPEFPNFRNELTGLGLFVWRGMKIEAPDGKLIHVFPLDVQGSDEAEEAVWQYLQKNDRSILVNAITEAMLATDMWKPAVPSEKQDGEPAEGPAPKNSQT